MNKINETFRIGKTQIHVPHLKGVSREQFNEMFKHLDFNKEVAWKGVQEKLEILKKLEEGPAEEKVITPDKKEDAGKSAKSISKNASESERLDA